MKKELPIKQQAQQPLRKDLDYCNFCNKKYEGFLDRFSCKYCGFYYCSDHRLPEAHNCKGNPKSPGGGFREIHHSGGAITAYGK